MARRTLTFLLMATLLVAARSGLGADILYDTLNQPVHVDGNFSDGVWLALSFRTLHSTDSLESVTIALRNPNFLSAGSIQFTLFDALGPGGLPGGAIGTPLGSVAIADISTNAYQQVTFDTLHRPVENDTNYWIVVASDGLSGPYFIGATQSTGGSTTGSSGFTMSTNLGVNWNPASTSFLTIGQVISAPEPSTLLLGLVAAIMVSIRAIRPGSSTA
ncbi:hypothetical protein GC170_21615 [bacterium]|nr:hypothetical protein [bacterium]